MARMRTIKPEFWIDDKIVDLSILAKLLFIGMWNFADDDGYLEDSERRVKRMVFPDNDYDIGPAIRELVKAGMLARATSDQGSLLHIVKFKDHQKPQHPTPTKFSNIKGRRAVSHEDSGALSESSPRRGEESSGEESRKPAERASRVPSNFTITADMRDWAKTHAPLVDLDLKLSEWLDYWTGVPGAKGVKSDWIATWRNGMRKQQQFAEADRGKKPTGKVTPANEWMYNR